jgi:NAD(P)-dependent dehydrogenase (short-subunit alcohol dehydrogenase family)
MTPAIGGNVAKQTPEKVVVVAGGSAGIGKATARRFADEGAHVVVLARHKDRLDEAIAEIGSHAVGIVADISDPASVRDAFTEIDTRHGRIDVLLNVAGVARVRRIEEASDEDIATVVGTNFLGPIYTTRAAIPLLRKSGGGDIVNVSSEITLDDMPLMTLYSSSKRALDGFTRSMTKELKEDGIRVTLVVMGTVGETAFTDNFMPGDAERAMPLWLDDGYMQRVAGADRPMDVTWVAETMLYVVTRPRGMMLDVIHTRVF